jgi:hypothetical protein
MYIKARKNRVGRWESRRIMLVPAAVVGNPMTCGGTLRGRVVRAGLVRAARAAALPSFPLFRAVNPENVDDRICYLLWRASSSASHLTSISHCFLLLLVADASGNAAVAQLPTKPPPPDAAAAAPRFEIKKWNAVAMWSWDICADTVRATKLGGSGRVGSTLCIVLQTRCTVLCPRMGP